MRPREKGEAMLVENLFLHAKVPTDSSLAACLVFKWMNVRILPLLLKFYVIYNNHYLLHESKVVIYQI
jgi:hypothetical protein